MEHSLHNGPQYETYKQSLRLREQRDYEENELALHKEFLEPQKLVQISEDILDFGFQGFMTNSSQREIVLTNSLPVDLTVFWTIQDQDVEASDEKQIVFNVSPAVQDLKAGSTCKFEVNFKPTKNSFYFF